MERWVRECAAQIGCLSTSQVTNDPFYLKIGLDIGRVFAKSLIFNVFFLWFTYRLSKRYLRIPIYMVKVGLLFGLKKGPSRNKWFRHRLQNCVFSDLVIGWWSKLLAAHPYPTQSWVPPRDPIQANPITPIQVVIFWEFLLEYPTILILNPNPHHNPHPNPKPP